MFSGIVFALEILSKKKEKKRKKKEKPILSGWAEPVGSTRPRPRPPRPIGAHPPRRRLGGRTVRASP
jgi:hypothetical protein